MDIKHATIKPLLFALALLPGVALADEHCKFSQPQAMDLALAGVKAVVFEVNSHDLRLQASPGARAALSGRACASSQDLLGQLSLTQEKVGDKLVVRLQRESRGLNIGFGSSYAWLDITGTLPDTLLVQLKVGSGDASLSGAQAMSADVGSGDVKARDIKALATAAVGSGDIELDNVGALHVVSIGSGDARVGGGRGGVLQACEAGLQVGLLAEATWRSTASARATPTSAASAARSASAPWARATCACAMPAACGSGTAAAVRSTTPASAAPWNCRKSGDIPFLPATEALP